MTPPRPGEDTAAPATSRARRIHPRREERIPDAAVDVIAARPSSACAARVAAVTTLEEPVRRSPTRCTTTPIPHDLPHDPESRTP